MSRKKGVVLFLPGSPGPDRGQGKQDLKDFMQPLNHFRRGFIITNPRLSGRVVFF
jgi:hypothetical protein